VNPETLIVPALRGESVAWPSDTPAFVKAVLDTAAEHGVTTLLSRTSTIQLWPDALRLSLRAASRREAAIEAVRRTELVAVLDALAHAGIRTLLLKGAQLAYTCYPQPWLRPRLDTDLLVAPDDRTRADEILRGLGYRPGTHFSGDLVTHQFRYERSIRYGFTDAVDLHWRIANPHMFADTLTFEELAKCSKPIDALGPNALGPSDAHALLLACIHRVAHHDNSDRLIWLYDIHLLAGSMSAETRATVAEAATAKALRAVCASGIELAQHRFATALPQGWTEQLETDNRASEPTAMFLRSGRNKVDDLFSDLQMLDGWQPRMKLLREHLFPPVAYIRHAYGLANPVWIPLGYAHRIVTGFGKWFHRSGRPS
jgi:hypothetical protein